MWTERSLGRALQRDVFNREVLVIDNCLVTGFETDLLIVERGLRLIDVEIKCTRADFKADYHKDKWIAFGPGLYAKKRSEIPRKLWPRDVWKHYYAMPEDVWRGELVDHLGSPNSGVITIGEKRNGDPSLTVHRRAKPNKDAKPLGAAEVLNIARLASLRLWNAYADIERAAEDLRRAHVMYGSK